MRFIGIGLVAVAICALNRGLPVKNRTTVALAALNALWPEISNPLG